MYVLVVHNQTLARVRIRTLLEDRGHRVIEAANGDDAIGVIRSNSFEGTGVISAVICQADMRRGSGVDLMKKLKEHYMLRALHFIIFNAKMTTEFDNMIIDLREVAERYKDQRVHFCLWRGYKDNEKFIEILGVGKRGKRGSGA